MKACFSNNRRSPARRRRIAPWLLGPFLLICLAACDSTSMSGAGNNDGARGRVSMSLPF